MLVAAETLSISLHTGTVLLVARADQTQLGELHESARRRHAGGAVNGVIFNALDLTRRYYGRHGYKYGAYQYRQYAYARPDQRRLMVGALGRQREMLASALAEAGRACAPTRSAVR